MALDSPDVKPVATYAGEEIYATFSGTPISNDYGVPGSPVWTTIEDIEIDSLEILGISVDIDALPIPLQERILELSDDLEWELV